MPSMDLWIDGSGMDTNAGWRTPIKFNFDQFACDREFAARVSDHIQRSLENLAREVEEIGTQMPPLLFEWGTTLDRSHSGDRE